MKKLLTTIIALLIIFAMVIGFASCGTSEKTDPWQNATYKENKEFGEGSKKFSLEVKVNDHSVIFTINTDEKTVGAALLNNELIAGEEGQYGLYVKSVNGIVADYDIDKSYWAFNINGEYAMTGVDSTDIEEGAEYQLVYTKE